MMDSPPRRAPGPAGLAHANALPTTPHVVVVGGGIAGLAAATGLVERGISVEVLEREPNLGGRVAGWTETLEEGEPAGTEVANNRGFRVLPPVLQPAGAAAPQRPRLDRLRAVEDYPLIDGEGRRDTFRGLPKSPPWNALVFALRSPTFRFRDLLRLNAVAAAPLAACRCPTSTTGSTTSTPRRS